MALLQLKFQETLLASTFFLFLFLNVLTHLLSSEDGIRQVTQRIPTHLVDPNHWGESWVKYDHFRVIFISLFYFFVIILFLAIRPFSSL